VNIKNFNYTSPFLPQAHSTSEDIVGSPPTPDTKLDENHSITICPIGANTLEFPKTPFVKTVRVFLGPASTFANSLKHHLNNSILT
jgi:hypothetical protein